MLQSFILLFFLFIFFQSFFLLFYFEFFSYFFQLFFRLFFQEFIFPLANSKLLKYFHELYLTIVHHQRNKLRVYFGFLRHQNRKDCLLHHFQTILILIFFKYSHLFWLIYITYSLIHQILFYQRLFRNFVVYSEFLKINCNCYFNLVIFQFFILANFEKYRIFHDLILLFLH